MTSSIDVHDYDISLQLTAKLLIIPPLIAYRKSCQNQDVSGCEAQLVEMIHSTLTVYLPQTYYY